MPEGGDIGSYTNWVGWSNGHFRPQWETFHIGQLVPWVDDNFRTSRTAGGRAIAGLSMGGLGAMKYAGTHSDLFSAVGGFSGTVSLRRDDFKFSAAAAVNTFGASVGSGDGDPYGDAFTGTPFLFPASYQPRESVIFGPESGWSAFNPVDRATAGAYASYAGRVYVYSGTDNDLLEGPLRQANDQFHAALSAAGTAHRYCRGPGNHTWPFWRGDLRDFLANVYGSGTTTCTQNAGWTRVP
jgi:S-formylglutathione hydrolase FrmB